MPAALNTRSRTLVHGAERAGARAMLKAVGYDDEALAKPLIGVANTWTEIGPCNFHLRKLAADVKRGIREAGGTPFEFNTVSISDGITMGTEGMKGSLISREVIADSIELVAKREYAGWRGGAFGLRQDHPGHHHGADPPRSAFADALWRHDLSRLAQWARCRPGQCFRGAGAIPGWVRSPTKS